MRYPASPLAASLLLVGAIVAPSAHAAAESTTVGGKIFADFTNLKLENDGTNAAATGTGVDVKRFYLGATHTFDDVWSVNVTTDFNYVANDGQTQVYVKKAYVQAKLSDALVGRIGSADLPWVPFVEDLYGFRFVENTLIDRLKFGTSADWGLHAGGKLGDGFANYAVSVVNGAGYKNPTRSKSLDYEARVGIVPVAGLTLAIGGYDGKLGKDLQGATTFHSAQRFDAVAGYVNANLRVGAEAFQARDWNQVATVATDKADGYSVWASYNVTPTWGVFARGDWAKPSKDLKPSLKDEYFNAGAVAHVRKNVDLAFAWKHEKVTGNGVVSTGNGAIGATRDGKYDEVGLWAQASF
jgi:hypothetical protein